MRSALWRFSRQADRAFDAAAARNDGGVVPRYGAKKPSSLTRRQFGRAMRALGVAVPEKAMFLVFRRANAAARGPAKARVVTRKQLHAFLDLLPGEVDLLAQAVRREVRRALRRGVRLREAFERLDADNDGKLDAGEFVTILRSHGGLALSAHDERLLVGHLDKARQLLFAEHVFRSSGAAVHSYGPDPHSC